MDILELSECWYRGAVRLMGSAPESLHQMALHGTDSVVVLLGLLFLACAWRHRTRPWPQRALLVTTPVAVCLAYAISEMLKALVAAERPCRAVTDVIILAERCPDPGDWSFPSNHATVAAALATAIVLLVPRMAAVAVPLAALAALSRVVMGVHYPHDVLGGTALGVAITTAVAVGAVSPHGPPDGPRPPRPSVTGRVTGAGSRAVRRGVIRTGRTGRAWGWIRMAFPAAAPVMIITKAELYPHRTVGFVQVVELRLLAPRGLLPGDDAQKRSGNVRPVLM